MAVVRVVRANVWIDTRIVVGVVGVMVGLVELFLGNTETNTGSIVISLISAMSGSYGWQ